MIKAGAYRVLVVDDEPQMCEFAERQIRDIAGPEAIFVQKAYTARMAIENVKATFFDLIILDLYRGNVLAGYEVYRNLNELDCAAEIIFMTRFDIDSSITPLLRAVSSEGSARMVGFLDKRDPKFGTIKSEVEKRYAKFTKADLKITNLSLAGRLISRRRKRYAQLQRFPLREDPGEIEAEVERLLRKIYVEVPNGPRRSADVSLALEPIERRSMRPDVVMNCTVKIKLRGADEGREGHETVLKIGPKHDIATEASRFREFVRYDAELEQRLELLGVAQGDSLGGLAYSFVDGLQNRGLRALDDVLVMDIGSPNQNLAIEVFKTLFRSRSQYSVKTEDIDVDQYFEMTYRNSLITSFGRAEEALFLLRDEFRNHVRVERVPAQGEKESHFAVEVGSSPTLAIPNSSILGLGSMYNSVPGRLVHGDMHAGNVILEISQDDNAPADNRVRLDRPYVIDFRSAGPGPRTIDAVALESSVRLADSEVACRRIKPDGEISLPASDCLSIAEDMVDRWPEEIRLYRAVFHRNGELPSHGWQAEAAEILFGLKSCFSDMTLEEYLITSIRYTVRLLGFDMLPVSRTRMLVWLAAQYSLLQEL